ncbi:hypothetical protein D5086_031842 [Populus alba]|uniref:Uncharacterized protein n=1 Tax=Populus alba TaxID=43335 RepID=A0ACC4AJQ7_POPAL
MKMSGRTKLLTRPEYRLKSVESLHHDDDLRSRDATNKPKYRLKRTITLDSTVGSCSNVLRSFRGVVFYGVVWKGYSTMTTSCRAMPPTDPSTSSKGQSEFGKAPQYWSTEAVSIVSHSYQTYFGFSGSDLNLDCGLRDHVITRFASGEREVDKCRRLFYDLEASWEKEVQRQKDERRRRVVVVIIQKYVRKWLKQEATEVTINAIQDLRANLLEEGGNDTVQPCDTTQVRSDSDFGVKNAIVQVNRSSGRHPNTGQQRLYGFCYLLPFDLWTSYLIRILFLQGCGSWFWEFPSSTRIFNELQYNLLVCVELLLHDEDVRSDEATDTTRVPAQKPKYQKKDNTTRPILHPFSLESLLPIFKSFTAHHLVSEHQLQSNTGAKNNNNQKKVLLELRLTNLTMAGDKEDLPRGLSLEQAQVMGLQRSHAEIRDEMTGIRD